MCTNTDTQMTLIQFSAKVFALMISTEKLKLFLFRVKRYKLLKQLFFNQHIVFNYFSMNNFIVGGIFLLLVSWFSFKFVFILASILTTMIL